MILDKLKPLLPHVIAVVLFIVISLANFTPLFEGKVMQQHDIQMYRGMAKEVNDYRDQNGKEALWTNSMFGGMPAYQISVVYKNNIAKYANDFFSLKLDVPARYLFLSLVGFYILLLAFKLDPWISFAGALAFGFSSYFFIIEAAGHNSKAHSMALMAPVIAGILLSFRGKHLLGGVLTALFLALQLNANHLQITYYTFLIILILGIVELTMAIKNHTIPNFMKSMGVLLVAATLAVGCNFTNLWLTSEYGKYSTRGKSELTSNSADQTSGLDKSYILNDYSYGIAETADLFIPNFMGGASSGELDTKSNVYQFLKSQNIANAEGIIKQIPLYWGDQRFTSGPVYIGAVVIFLFILGLFVVRGSIKWWLVSATILSILLAWGRNFEFFSNLFIDYFPGYNKFRTVSMILVIAELTIPLLGILGLWKMFTNELKPEEKLKALRNAAAIAGGIALFFVLLPGMFFDFSSSSDSQLKQSGWPEQLIAALCQDRKSLLQADAFRSLVFVLLSAGVIWAYLKNKVTTKIACVAFSILILADLGWVGKRYLNSSNFKSKMETREPFKPSPADQAILADKSLDYRVANLMVSTFNDASTSYFHKSIGGYHGAKLKRYQEVIDYQMGGELQKVYNAFNSKPTPEKLDSVFAGLRTINMLNTKYMIYSAEALPLVNKHALGNAWFVQSYQWVKNADEEIKTLGTIDPGKEAIIDQRFKSSVNNFAIQPDTTASIKLAEYGPNHLVYKTKAKNEQLAVFSEIYYEKGWNAYVDGKLTPHFRADYILRSMLVPAGDHTIEFRFEPKSFIYGENISLASSILIVMMILGVVAREIIRLLKS
ncbi:MAG: YfhO family protein [Bacteroidota bacterium]|nr:YfhO family protein [Bacteroidota bacterium]